MQEWPFATSCKLLKVCNLAQEDRVNVKKRNAFGYKGAAAGKTGTNAPNLIHAIHPFSELSGPCKKTTLFF